MRDSEALSDVLAKMQRLAEDPGRQQEAERWERQRDLEAQQELARRQRDQRAEAIRDLPLTEADARMLAGGQERDTESLEAVRKWAEARNTPVLVLCGSVGRGKTIAAGWLLATHGGRYEGARALQRLFRADFGDQLEEQERIMRAGNLVVDDLGREDDAVRMTSVLLDLVDWRRRRNHRTLLISNLSRKAFRSRYSDERLLSRLRECARWVHDKGEDMRASRAAREVRGA